MSGQLSKVEIFKMVEQKKISAEEAFRMLKELRTGKSEETSAVIPSSTQTPASAGVSGGGSILEKIQIDLVKAVSDILKIDEKKVLIDKDLKDFGFDSISFTAFNNLTGEKYGINIPPAIFLEFSTIEALSKYLVDEHKEIFVKHYGSSIEVNQDNAKVTTKQNTAAPVEEKKITAVPVDEKSNNSGVWLINVMNEFPMDFWKKIQDEGLPADTGKKLTKEEFNNVMNGNNKYIHALVETSSGSKMEVLSCGKGVTAVLVGGIGMAASMSFYQIEALSKNYRVLVIHNPGCGMSEDIGEYSLSYRSTIVYEILQKLGITDPVHFIGMSFGGMVGQYFCKNYPEMAASLSLVSSIHEIVDENPGVNANDSMRMDLERAEGGIKYLPLLEKGICLNPVIFTKYMNQYLPGSDKSYSSYDMLHEIKAPVLIVSGLVDKIINPRQSREMHAKIAGSEHYEIPGAGHFLFMTHHEVLNEKLLEFMGKHDASRAGAAQHATISSPSNAFPVALEDYEDFIKLVEEKLDKELAIKGVEEYFGFEESANKLCTTYILEYLEKNGVSTAKGRIYDIDELRSYLRVLPKFNKFFNFFIKCLLDDRIIRELDNKIQFLKEGVSIGRSEHFYKEILAKFPQFKGMLEFLHYCAGHYTKALNGEIFAIGVLFPNGKADMLEDSTRRTVVHGRERLYAGIVREIIRVILDKFNSGRKLRILEVGGGNGLLTRELVAVTNNPNVEYYFTDLGESFVKKAKADSAFSFMNFGMLDISRDPASQGYQKHSFDMVLGLNVVHATKNIGETISNLKTLLAPGGTIALVEATRQMRWVDMVWGLAEGWWYFEDEDIRKYSPLVSLGTWEKILRKQKFSYIKTYPADNAKRFDADCGLIIAQDELGSKVLSKWITIPNIK